MWPDSKITLTWIKPALVGLPPHIAQVAGRTPRLLTDNVFSALQFRAAWYGQLGSALKAGRVTGPLSPPGGIIGRATRHCNPDSYTARIAGVC